MLVQKPSFSTSWRQLTRDKGWIKPLLVLTLVGWIPIVGQIAILGYALEWARLTAWGVEAAPKQGKVDYGKIMHTGFIGFLIMLSMGIALMVIDVILFGTMGSAFSAFPMTSMLSSISSGAAGALSLVTLVVNMLFGIFISVAMMRAVIYDKFSAGWRLDRIFEMIGKDVAGFFRIYLVSIIGGVISWLYSAIVGFIASLVFIGAFFGAAGAAGGYASLSSAASERLMAEALLQMGSGAALIFMILAVALLFVGGVIGTAVQLISINAVGQWFSRFDVQRWGLSGDPLPAGTPLPVSGEAPAASPVAPEQPAAADAEEVPATPVSPVEVREAEPVPAAPVTSAETEPAEPAPAVSPEPAPAPVEDVVEPYQPATGADAEQGRDAVDAPVEADPVTAPAEPDPVESEPEIEPVPEPELADPSALAADAAAAAAEAAEAAERPAAEPATGIPSDSSSL